MLDPLTPTRVPIEAALAEELHRLEERGLRRSLAGPLPAETINFSSNDYLGLATHPALSDAACHALRTTTGAGSARLIGGDLAEHRALEDRVAEYKNTERALLFSTGYQANLGVLTALLSPGDAVYSDALNHASLIDGCRLSRAAIHVFPHADPDALGRLLAEGSRYRRRLVVTDSVFGMDGDRAPLAALARLARHHDAILVVDEAHATGVCGPHGSGAVAEAGIAPDVQIATFGKALGCFGAAALGSRVLIDYLTNRARSFVFTTALPPAICAAARAALDVAASAEGDRLRERVQRNLALLHAGLARLGRDGVPTGLPIVPLHLGSPEAALAASAALLERGFFVQAIRPPTVPPGTSRLRISLSARHEPEQLQRLLSALAEVLPPPRKDLP
ncbi:MAG: 8-amino-7-oxononanoate synthase [Deltaproteobacteria bacterium]|nr:8-amino-7-oxononanoate synthase [Deltaproteobacteria bacterium]